MYNPYYDADAVAASASASFQAMVASQMAEVQERGNNDIEENVAEICKQDSQSVEVYNSRMNNVERDFTEYFNGFNNSDFFDKFPVFNLSDDDGFMFVNNNNQTPDSDTWFDVNSLTYTSDRGDNFEETRDKIIISLINAWKRFTLAYYFYKEDFRRVVNEQSQDEIKDALIIKFTFLFEKLSVFLNKYCFISNKDDAMKAYTFNFMRVLHIMLKENMLSFGNIMDVCTETILRHPEYMTEYYREILQYGRGSGDLIGMMEADL